MSFPSITLPLDCHEKTIALGQILGLTAQAGGVIALVGDLGAGKTTFTQGFCAGVGGIDTESVSSPTFVLLQHYPGRLTVHHFDVYRLESLEQFWDLGPSEYCQGDGVALVEWADRVAPLLPDDRLQIELVHTPMEAINPKEAINPNSQLTEGRKAILQPLGPVHNQWLNRAKEQLEKQFLGMKCVSI